MVDQKHQIDSARLDALIERRTGLRVEVYWTDLRGTLAVR